MVVENHLNFQKVVIVCVRFVRTLASKKKLCRILRMLCLTGELKLDAHAKLNVITACENAPLVVKKN
jgi:hypothetical protein